MAAQLRHLAPRCWTKNDEFSAHNDRRYAHLPADVVPDGENLKVTLQRVLPFWEDHIAPAIIRGKRVLVAAHGNSLRALAKHIEGISDNDIMGLEIPTGQPLVYKLDDDLNVVEKFYFVIFISNCLDSIKAA